MSLPQLCIRRPVLTIALNLVLIIIGILCFTRLSVSEYPQINSPTVTIRASFPGASAELMETEVATPVESAVSSVSGIEQITSSSTQDEADIRVQFAEDYDINAGLNDIRDQMSRIARRLPQNMPALRIMKSDSSSRPSLGLAVTDDRLDAMQLTDYVMRNLQPQLQEISGVSDVRIWGGKNYSMNIDLDPLKMGATNVTVPDILNALAQQSANVPGGNLDDINRTYPILMNANLTTAEQFGNLIAQNSNGVITHFKDVGSVQLGEQQTDQLSAFRVRQKNGLALMIVPEATANPVTISDDVALMLKNIAHTLPTAMTVNVLFDTAVFIKQSIHEVYKTLGITLILVIAVVFLFLGSWRSVLIPMMTLPVCLVSIFAVLYAFNYSINTITLLALVLAIGLVVDDAIVMLENIYRHIEAGMNPFAAAMKGSQEIVFAIIAMTLTLVAVYFPVAFVQGLTGILFRQFAVTLAGAVVISGFVALTLSPMMCSRLLVANSMSGYQGWVERQLHRLMLAYKVLLEKLLRFRLLIVIVFFGLAIAGYFLYQSLPTELAPGEDRGYVWTSIQAPTNSSFSYTDRYTQQIEKILAGIPEASNYFVSVGDGSQDEGMAQVILKPWDQRKKTQQQIAMQLNLAFAAIVGVNAFAVNPAPFQRLTSTNHAVEINLMTASDYKTLQTVSNNLATALRKYPGLTSIDTSLQYDDRQFNVNVNRNLAADLNVNVTDITNTISTLLGTLQATTFEYDGQDYNVEVGMSNPNGQQDFSVFDKIYVRNLQNKMIPLSSIVTVTPMVGPSTLPHFNRLRAAGVDAELAPGYSIGEVVDYLQRYLPHQLPDNVQYQFSGAAQDYLDSHNRMNLIFTLAMLFIFLTLAAQFESFIDPFIVLLTVPFSMIGGLLALHLTGGSMNIYTQIGLISLIGLISKHGILITQFANQICSEGKTRAVAVVEAAALRLRPILMTTGAMVLGALPLALASGAGSSSRQQIGWVIVGGMLLGTFFSLVVVPVAYVYLGKLKPKNSSV